MSNKTLSRFAAALTLAFVAAAMSGCGTRTVDLNKYVEIEADGYDTVGTVEIRYDKASLRKDLKDKIKVNTKKMDKKTAALYEDMDSEDLVDALLESCVDGSFDKDSDLENGDEVVWTWECDDEKASTYFNCKLKYSDITQTVSDLEEAAVFDPFEHVTVSYSGMDGSGSLSMEKDNALEVMSRISFRPSVDNSLKNGDSITLTADIGTDIGSFVEQYGMLPSPTEKTYTVEGLPAYLTSSEQITEDALEKMKNQVEDSLIGSTASWNTGTVLDSQNYIGYYLISAKDSAAYMKNEVYVVYKVNTISTLTNSRTKETENWTNTYYYYLGFKDLMLLPDGTLTVDTGNYDRPGSFYVDTGVSNGYYGTHSLSFQGCATLDDVHKEAVVKHIENYNYEVQINEE